MNRRDIFGLGTILAIYAGVALAADNTVKIDPGTTVTTRSVDIGAGVQLPGVILMGATGASILGTAGTANAGVLSVQGIASGTALAISAASLPLPSGAATSAKQPALGTAGASSIDVLSVQGIASGTAMPVSQATGTVASGAYGSGAFASGALAGGAIVDLGAQADAVCSTNVATCSSIAVEKRIASNTAGPFPYGATPITISATGTTAATTGTLAATSGKTTYICGYTVDADAAAAVSVTMTVTGVITGTMTRRYTVGVTDTSTGHVEQNFSPCVPASASNTTIAVVSGAAASSGHTQVVAWGFQL